jgi:phosphatidylserine decarboxylase
MRWQTLQQGLWFIIGLAAATIAAFYLLPWLAIVPGVLLLFTLWFFRDPPRQIPSAPDVVVSPADGRITDIIEIVFFHIQLE